jgi:dienelactone hydrolase
MKRSSLHRFLHLLVLVGLSLSSPATRAAEDLTVLQPSADGVTPGKQIELWLKQEFYKAVDRRSAEFEVILKSEAACRKWQADRRAFFLDKIGGLPPRTPLNAQIVGRLQGQGYSVEKIIFESRPGFHVTGNLYLPNTPPPWPAVLVPCGHSHDGKTVGQYQRASILLAKNGMAAMCYDPIGQGERYQMLDVSQQRSAFEDAKHVKTPHPNVRYMCTTEHTMIGLGSALVGGNTAGFRVWDGMRVIDYLQSRSDIIADKIGCTGNSGGGTETAYLMALDSRIVAAAPGCYLTTFRRLIDGKGPQDGEQNIAAQIAFGMDEADYCIMRAPLPTLICAGTRDVTFDFRGTWEVFFDAKRFYSRLGRPDAIDLAAPDAPHGFTIQLREAVASFMHRWLLGKDKVIREIEKLPDTIADKELWDMSQGDWTPEQLQCTPKGQVLLLGGERSVFEINGETATALKTPRTAAWQALDLTGKRKLIRETINAQPADPSSPTKIETVGKLSRGSITIHKLVLTLATGTRLPALAFVPAKPTGAATLYLHGVSMSADAAPGGPIEALAQQGQIVLAAELRGIGETETGHDKVEFGRGRFGRDNLEIFVAYLIGKSFVGMRTEDVSSWTRVLNEFAPTGTKPTELHLVALGEAAIPALHAAALDSDAYRSVTLVQMLPSWEAIVRATETYDQWINVVHGALKNYDLPDLLPLVGESKVKLSEPGTVLPR